MQKRICSTLYIFVQKEKKIYIEQCVGKKYKKDEQKTSETGYLESREDEWERLS